MTSRQVTGTIARVSSKPFKDNRSGEDIMLYSFQLDGSNQWFRTGTNPVQAGVGQAVKFVADGANVEKGTLAITQAAVVSSPSTSAVSASPQTERVQSASQPARSATGARSAGTKDDYWAAKEARDVEKDARFAAISEPRMALSVATEAAATVVATAISKDLLSFGTAKKADKVGLLSAYVKEVALDLAAFIHDAPNQLAAYKASAGTPKVSATDNEASSEVQE